MHRSHPRTQPHGALEAIATGLACLLVLAAAHRGATSGSVCDIELLNIEPPTPATLIAPPADDLVREMMLHD